MVANKAVAAQPGDSNRAALPCKRHNAFEQIFSLRTRKQSHTKPRISDTTEHQYDKTCVTGLVLYLCLDAASETLLLVQLTWIYLLPLPHYYTLHSPTDPAIRWSRRQA